MFGYRLLVVNVNDKNIRVVAGDSRSCPIDGGNLASPVLSTKYVKTMFVVIGRLAALQHCPFSSPDYGYNPRVVGHLNKKKRIISFDQRPRATVSPLRSNPIGCPAGYYVFEYRRFTLRGRIDVRPSKNT